MDHSVSLLNYKQNLNPMSSVLMSKTIYEEYFEVQPNLKKELYDEAVAELKTFCEGVDLKSVTSLKYHATLSSSIFVPSPPPSSSFYTF